MVLRDTKLLAFGNPVGGTPAMVASPLVALDLPLKVLVWMDDDVAVWIAVGSGSTPRVVLRHRGYLGACRGRLAVREVKVVNVEAQLDRASLGTRGRPEQSEVEVLTVRPRVLTVRLLV